jgi:hypothetical protein
MADLISINEAAARGIERVREPRWLSKLDHLKIDIIDGKPGPWLHLMAPQNKSLCGRDQQDILSFQHDMNAKEFEPYTGPLPDSEEYRTAVSWFERMERNG